MLPVQISLPSQTQPAPAVWWDGCAGRRSAQISSLSRSCQSPSVPTPRETWHCSRGAPVFHWAKPASPLAAWSRLPFSLTGLFGSWHLSDSVSTAQDQKALKLRLSLARFLGILQLNFFFYLCNISKKYFTICIFLAQLSVSFHGKKVFGNWRIVIVELFLKESPYTILGQNPFIKVL